MEYVKEYCPASVDAKFPPKIVKDSVSKKATPAAKPKKGVRFCFLSYKQSIDKTNKIREKITINLNETLKGSTMLKKETIKGGKGK